MRTVEPHVWHRPEGHRALRAHQVGGGSESGKDVGWKIFHERDMHDLAELPQRFQGPRPEYKRWDQLFARIEAQL